MNREGFIQRMTACLKLVRTEYGFSQDKMAAVLGMSKKSLVETEKSRRQLSWNEAVTLAVICSGSNVLQNEFGGETSDMIRAIAFENSDVTYPWTMGGRIWWNVIEEHDGYRIQQNILSGHYRLLDPRDGRMISSFDLDEIRSFIRKNALFNEENEK